MKIHRSERRRSPRLLRGRYEGGALTAPPFFDKLRSIGARFFPGSENGEVSEWLKEHAWKACVRRKVYRGFESRPLRHSSVGTKEP